MTGTEESKIRRYKASLIGLWNMVHSTNYTVDHSFTNEELFTITPEQVTRYMCMKAYGTETPNLSTDLPTVGRSSSLEFAKKAISFFMPSRLLPWNEQSRSGNPTKSVQVNDLIKAIKKKEVRKQGKASQARRPMKMEEFVALIKRLRGREENMSKYTVAAYFIFQFHMIARLDDVMNFSVQDLTPNPDYPGTLKSKMCWSKNVLDERDSPDQIILGAGDPTFCPIVALAIHLDHSIAAGLLNERSKLFGINKSTAADHLNQVIRGEGFPLFDKLPLGTHSIRKFPSTYARRNGCSRDDVDVRGRWKRMKRMVDTYIDVELPYPDAKVAAVLAIGGPVRYELREGCRLTDQWVLENVGEEIKKIFPDMVAILLGKALLWAIYDDSMSKILNENKVARVKENVARLTSRVLNVGVNPVEKVALLISGDNDALVITELNNDNEQNGAYDNNNDGVDENGNVVTARDVARQTNRGFLNEDRGLENKVRVLMTTVNNLRRQNDELKNEIVSFKQSNQTMMKQMNSSIKRLTMLPVSRVTGFTSSTTTTTSRIDVASVNNSRSRMTQHGGGDEQGGINDGILMGDGDGIEATNETNSFHTTLCKCPRSLYVLWQEYQFGIGGRKPARLFNSAERGKVKFNYCLRKHFWTLMEKMIRNGYTFNTAIDKIYSVYDRSRSVTQILRCIRNDAKNGGHPQLTF